MPLDFPSSARKGRSKSRPKPSPIAAQVGQARKDLPEIAPDPFDFDADPILQRIKALGQRGRSEAEADAQQLQRQLAIEYGDETIGGEAAKNNPFSFLSKMKKARAEEPKALDEGLSKQGGYYSSERNRRQSEVQSSLLDRESTGASKFRGGISEILGGLRSRLTELDEADIAAAEAAAGRRQEQIADLPVQGNSLADMIRGASPALIKRPALKAVPRRGIRY